jgi:hypothetical protein
MRIAQLVAQVAADPFAEIPWPAQLGLTGVLILTIVLILRWQNQQVQKGNLVSKALYEEMVKIKDDQITAERARAEEWRGAHALSEKAREVERDTTRAAVQSNRLQEAYMDRFVSDLGTLTGGATPSPNPGRVPHNGDQKGAS